MSHIDGDDHMTKDLIDSLESKDNDLSLVTSNTQIPDVEVANLTHDADEINQLFDTATNNVLPESNKKDKPIDTQDLHEDDPKAVPKTTSNGESTSNSNSVSPKLFPNDGKSTPKIQKELRRKSTFVPVTSNSKLLEPSEDDNNNNNNNSRISAYARLDFENFTFFVQTLQVVLGRKSNDETLQQNVDVHLSSKKAISRRHAKIFYNFGTQRFEISILGRNGAFVDNVFVEKGLTIPLTDGNKIQIGDIPFKFVLPSNEPNEENNNQDSSEKQFNPSDAINLRSNLYSKSSSPQSSPKRKPQPSKKVKKEPVSASNTPKDIKPTPPVPTTAISPTTSSSSPTASISTSTNAATAATTITPATTTAARKNSINRRNSLLKIRRLSNARRKSLAANDEINELLKDLGVTSIDEINEEDSELLDAQIQSLLDEDNENLGGIEDSLMKLAEFNESAIDDDDDDEEEGNENSQADLDRLEKTMEHDAIDDEIKAIDSNLTLLDDEISKLTPLINDTNQGLLEEKETKKKQLEEEKRKKQLQQLQHKNSLAKFPRRSAPLMGKPASIQPPASSSIYSRINGLDKIGKTVSPRPPPPKLIAPVLRVTAEPSAIRSRPPLRAITVSDSSYIATFSYPKTIEEPSKYPKPKVKKEHHKKHSKKVYSLDEIPEPYRSKPNISFQIMITNVLKTEAARNGLTINEITEAIKEVYPYYKYCTDGWQFSINHCIKFTKIYKRLQKRGSEWLYAMDELYINERENIRIKQREIAKAKAKAEALRQEEIRQRQRLEAQKSLPHNIVGRNFALPYPNTRVPPNQYNQFSQSSSSSSSSATTTTNGQYGSTTMVGGTSPQAGSIRAQLAAVRGNGNTPATTSTTPSLPAMNDPKTKKSLEYLQKELFTLYKARKLTYDTQTATSLITKAVATTIAQVNSIGAKAGAGDNALVFLVERAPEKVSKILDIALTKSIKEHEGIASKSPSQPATPGMRPAQLTTTSQSAATPTTTPQISNLQSLPVKPPISTPLPQVPQQQVSGVNIPGPIATPNIGVTSGVGNLGTTSIGTPTPTQIQSPATSVIPAMQLPQKPVSTPIPTSVPVPLPVPSAPLARPPLFGKPPGAGSSLSRPKAFGKPPGAGSSLSRPPTFLSNKPSYKRELEDDEEEGEQATNKIAKTE